MNTVPPGARPAAPRPLLPAASDFTALPLPGRSHPRLAALVHGGGAPLLMVHGSLSDARYWAPQIPALSADRRLYAPSLRDYFPNRDAAGGLPDLDWERDVEDMAALIAGLDAGPVDVMGHSRGGYIAYQLALRHPALVRRLVLAEPGGALPGSDAAPLRTWQEELAGLLSGGFTEQAVERFVDGVSRPGTWRQSPPEFRRMALDNAHTLPGQLRNPLPAHRPEQASQLRAPVLLVYGERSPRRFRDVVQALAGWLPRARAVGIPGASHGMNLAHPRAFNAAVGAFLSESSLEPAPQH